MKKLLTLTMVIFMAISIHAQDNSEELYLIFEFMKVNDEQGSNYLEVEVVNMWPNRLIGDRKLPKEERFTKTNINKFEAEDAEKYLRASGLLGPVILRKIESKRL